MKVLASNRKAYFNFDILEKYNSGIILEGWEVKAIKKGNINLTNAYIKIIAGEMYLVQSSVTKLHTTNTHYEVYPNRDRKLLLKSKEIGIIEKRVKESGVTIVPLEVFITDNNLVKLNLALVRGKKKFDKRQKLKEKDIKKTIDRDRKKYNF